MPALKTLPTGIAAWPQDERPRERLLSKGAQALTDAELVAILIRVGFKGTNAVEMARQLLKQFGSLRAMVEAPVIALLDVKGLKGAKAAQLIAATEIARRVSVPAARGQLVMKSTAAAAEYLRERLRGLAEEQFRVLYLNRRNALLEDALNRQKFLQSLGTLRRKAAKRVVYTLSPKALAPVNTATRQVESCSAAELRRGSKTVFYVPGCDGTLVDEQKEFFHEVEDPDGDFRGGREEIINGADFKTPVNLVIADAMPERKFVRLLVTRENAQKLDAWLKNTSIGFYWIEYAWKKGNRPKRGEFSPDFFIKQGDQIFVVEIKDNEEIADPSADNIKKHEYATDHFKRLNQWLERAKIPTRYQFNMISPKSYNVFFQKLRDGGVIGFRSDLDVAMTKAVKAGS